VIGHASGVWARFKDGGGYGGGISPWMEGMNTDGKSESGMGEVHAD
jgi:hypothetical protein